MRVHTDTTSLRGVQRVVLTTGTFDGVHAGHRVILERVVQLARRERGESVLFTFHPHPRLALYPGDNDLKLLNTQAEKQRLLEATGLDHLLVVPFSRAFSRMTALEYVRDVLVEGIGVHAVVIGHDHRFGRNREGDIHLLRQLGEVYDFQVEEIPAREIDHVQVSSTKIRAALAEGDVRVATSYLGYAYRLEGLVVKGDQVGRTLGFPTANIALLDPHKLVPADGVYAVRVEIGAAHHLGMLNIGLRPTLGGGSTQRTIEVHIFDLDADLYGSSIAVRLVDRIRPEMRFDDLDALKQRLYNDRDAARVLLSKDPH